MSVLFKPIKLGNLELPNRIIMAPLTRCRADAATRVPTELMVRYYRQRASAGLIITEATSVCPSGVGYPATPGIWSDEQANGWKKVVKAVHEAGGRIVLQLWHVGRISDPIYLDGEPPVAPSAVKPAGHPSLLRPIKDFETPRALELSEIKEIVASYRRGAEYAKKAGFDGVEIHGANGYLLDQFLQDSTNLRTDEYGGSIENRARLMLEVTDAVCEVWGAGHVGVHISPRCDAHDMGDSNPLAVFTYLAEQLGKRKLAFLFARAVQGDDHLSAKLKKAFGGRYIVNQKLTQADAEELIESAQADAASWGELFIANPDLVGRFHAGGYLNEPQRDLYYQGGEKGYTDYPIFEEDV